MLVSRRAFLFCCSTRFCFKEKKKHNACFKKGFLVLLFNQVLFNKKPGVVQEDQVLFKKTRRRTRCCSEEPRCAVVPLCRCAVVSFVFLLFLETNSCLLFFERFLLLWFFLFFFFLRRSSVQKRNEPFSLNS